MALQYWDEEHIGPFEKEVNQTGKQLKLEVYIHKNIGSTECIAVCLVPHQPPSHPNYMYWPPWTEVKLDRNGFWDCTTLCVQSGYGIK